MAESININNLLPFIKTDLYKKFEINKSTNCWELINSKSYGLMRIAGILVLTHRVFYAKFNGHLEDDLLVCHKCDNPRCVNPDHLFKGTHKDNALDASKKKRIRQGYNWSKEKTHCIRGHVLFGDNLKIRKNGTRECRECGKIRRKLRTKV